MGGGSGVTGVAVGASVGEGTSVSVGWPNTSGRKLGVPARPTGLTCCAAAGAIVQATAAIARQSVRHRLARMEWRRTALPQDGCNWIINRNQWPARKRLWAPA